MKYFRVRALANAPLVTGVILVMGMAGSTDYGVLAERMMDGPLTATGVALVLVRLLFKLGRASFAVLLVSLLVAAVVVPVWGRLWDMLPPTGAARLMPHARWRGAPSSRRRRSARAPRPHPRPRSPLP